MTTNVHRFLAALVLVVILPLTAFAQDKAALTPAQQLAVDTAVEAEMKKQELVGVAVGVLRDKKVVYVKGYGLADRDRSAAATSKTVFNWASNSKPILALLVMLLFGQGQIDLDEDVRKYVPEYPEQGKEVIKVRHLMCHMSGIPHYGPKVVARKKDHADAMVFLDPIVSLDRFSLSPLQFKPGEKVLYSSHAYVLLSAAAQRAGNKPLYDQVTAKIVKPLGLKSFQMDLPYKDQPNWATGYVKTKDGKVQKAPANDHFWKHGAGGYKSNIEDFATWAQALLTRKLHTQKLEEVMWKPQATSDGKETTWGLGFKVEREQGRLKISHNGKQEEATSRMVLFPEDGHGVVVMCNCDFGNPGAISTAVHRALAGK